MSFKGFIYYKETQSMDKLQDTFSTCNREWLGTV